MSTRRRTWWLALALIVAFVAVGLAGQGGRAGTAAGARGVKLITAADMKEPMRFLGAKEFRGRPAPSVELDIASRYIALEAERIGLKPLMPNGSYFQDLPVEVTTMSSARSHLRVFGPGGELRLSFPQAFTTSIRTGGEWSAVGGLVFAGSALNACRAEVGRRDRPARPVRRAARELAAAARRAGAAGQRRRGPHATATREGRRRHDHGDQPGARGQPGQAGPDVRRRRAPAVPRRGHGEPGAAAGPRPAGAPPPAQAPAAPAPFYAVEVRHDAAAALLGVTADQLTGYFDAIAAEPARAAAGAARPRRRHRRAVRAEDGGPRRTSSPICPGSDPVLKDEYVVIGSHHDHLNAREGRVFPGPTTTDRARSRC